MISKSCENCVYESSDGEQYCKHCEDDSGWQWNGKLPDFNHDRLFFELDHAYYG